MDWKSEISGDILQHEAGRKFLHLFTATKSMVEDLLEGMLVIYPDKEITVLGSEVMIGRKQQLDINWANDYVKVGQEAVLELRKCIDV